MRLDDSKPSEGMNTSPSGTPGSIEELREQIKAHRVLEDTIITEDGHTKVYHVQFEEQELLELFAKHDQALRERIEAELTETTHMNETNSMYTKGYIDRIEQESDALERVFTTNGGGDNGESSEVQHG